MRFFFLDFWGRMEVFLLGICWLDGSIWYGLCGGWRDLAGCGVFGDILGYLEIVVGLVWRLLGVLFFK